MGQQLLRIESIKKYFPVENGMFGNAHGVVHAVDDISINIEKNETLGLVGESGCGKSTLGRVILRIIEADEGRVFFESKNIYDLGSREMRKLRQEMQIIFQDPYSSLNPRMKIRDIVTEPLRAYDSYSKKALDDSAAELLNLVGLQSSYMDRYPHMFSGGQRQRIGIARALALKPKFIVCDEPVSALDVSIQSQIINLLIDIQEKNELTYLFISHDINVVHYISNRICVMFLGKVMEMGLTEEVYRNPLHPYTKFLLEAVPVPRTEERYREKPILNGDIPSPVNPPKGCRFNTRCPYASDICHMEEPPARGSREHFVYCHYPLE